MIMRFGIVTPVQAYGGGIGQVRRGHLVGTVVLWTVSLLDARVWGRGANEINKVGTKSIGIQLGYDVRLMKSLENHKSFLK